MKKNNLLLGFILLLTLMGCNQSVAFLYQDKDEVVFCETQHKALFKEAYYSFKEDLGTHYNKFTDYPKGSRFWYDEGYINYIYFGYDGNIPNLNEITSNHSIKIAQELKKIENLWVVKDQVYTLNYNHEFVKCILKNIKDEPTRLEIERLQRANYYKPSYIADFVRRNVLVKMDDPYLEIYSLLDAYYIHILNKNLQEK